LDNKVFDIIDARCNHEVHKGNQYKYFGFSHISSFSPMCITRRGQPVAFVCPDNHKHN